MQTRLQHHLRQVYALWQAQSKGQRNVFGQCIKSRNKSHWRINGVYRGQQRRLAVFFFGVDVEQLSHAQLQVGLHGKRLRPHHQQGIVVKTHSPNVVNGVELASLTFFSCHCLSLLHKRIKGGSKFRNIVYLRAKPEIHVGRLKKIQL